MAQADFFLKIDTIDGESTKDGHKGEIEIESWSWGEANSGTHGSGGGGGAGKVAMQDMHFTVTYGKASPKLFLACATGLPSQLMACHSALKQRRNCWVFSTRLAPIRCGRTPSRAAAF